MRVRTSWLAYLYVWKCLVRPGCSSASYLVLCAAASWHPSGITVRNCLGLLHTVIWTTAACICMHAVLMYFLFLLLFSFSWCLGVPLPAGLSSLPGFAGSRQIVLSSSSSHSSGPEPLFVPGGGVTSPNMQFRGILPMMNRAEHSASQQQSSNRSRRQQQQQQQRPPTQQHQTAHEPPAGQPTARLDGLQELLNSLGPVQHPGTGSHGTGATASGRSSNTPGSRFVSGDSSSSSVRGARHTAGTTTAAGDPVNNRTAPTSSRGNSSSHGSSSAVDVPAAAGAGNGNSPAEGRSYSILRLPVKCWWLVSGSESASLGGAWRLSGCP